MKKKVDQAETRGWHQALADIAAARARDVRALADEGEELHEKVHDARTTIKRLRAFWRLARPSIPERLFQRENTRLREAKHRLEGMRDRQVVRSTLQKIPDVADGSAAAAIAVRRLEPSLEAPERAQREQRTVRAALPGVMRDVDRSIAAFRALTLDGDEWLHDGLQRSFRRARKSGKLDATAADEALHTWRKRVKTLFYNLEALEPVGPGRVKRLRKHLDELQEQLGDDHDLVTLVRMLEDHASRSEAEAVRVVKQAAARRSRQLRQAALQSRKKLFGKKARKAVKKIPT